MLLVTTITQISRPAKRNLRRRRKPEVLKFSDLFLERGMSKVTRRLEKVTRCLPVKKARRVESTVLPRMQQLTFLRCHCGEEKENYTEELEVTWQIPACAYSPSGGEPSQAIPTEIKGP